MDDRKIVELFRKRDEAAIELTAKKYGARLFGLALSVLNDRQTAEECVNDVYMKVWESIPPNDPAGYFPTYLLRVTRQISLNRLKRENASRRSAEVCELTREMEECIPFPADPFDEVEAAELKRDINEFLSTLKKDKRDVFIRRYWFFDPVSDIAKRMGFKESKVKMMLLRMREELKAHLESKGHIIYWKEAENGRIKRS